MCLDSAFAENNGNFFLISGKKYQEANENLKSTLFSRGKRADYFFTEDSKLYVAPRQQSFIDAGIVFNTGIGVFDGISARIVRDYRQFKSPKSDFLYKKLLARIEKIKNNASNFPDNFRRQVSFIKLWNLSIASAIIIGMVSMTFIYRYLGVGVSAEGSTQKVSTKAATEQVLGVEEIKSDEETVKYIEDIIEELEESKKDEFEKEIKELVKGYPLEDMVPYIMEKDRTVAAFLVGIAKKESNWGKRVPVLNGQDCFNYWGYRGIRKKMGTGGHTCFDSRQDAIDTVAKRLKTLIEDKKLNTPAKMVIWKCGSACSKDDQAAVRKWISDVDIYFKKLN